MDFVGTKPVDPRHAFDLERLALYLRETIPGFPEDDLRVEQFKGGQSNPTFLLRAGRDAFVLRRKPPGRLLASAHAVDREFRVIKALAGTDVPVPRARCMCDDDTIIGTTFYVMDYVDGRVLWDPTLPGASNGERAAVFAEMNRVIAALHSVDPHAVGLDDFGKPGNYFARQIDRWSKQYRASETGKIEAMDRLMEWLPKHIPLGDETAIVHGDFRLDNLIFAPDAPRIVAVLDWELSTLGHPLADFAYHCVSWHIPTGLFRGLAGVDLAALGIPTEAEHAASYFRRTGRGGVEAADWSFYIAYNLFRIAAILQGIAGRVKDGTAASPMAVAMGQAAQPLADLGWAQARKLR